MVPLLLATAQSAELTHHLANWILHKWRLHHPDPGNLYNFGLSHFLSIQSELCGSGEGYKSVCQAFCLNPMTVRSPVVLATNGHFWH